jgi:hypothetical protein
VKDQRLYGKFTLDFPDHPKIAILSDAAFRCLVEATLWSRKQERDGLLPRRYAVARWGVDVLQELCCNDDTKPSLIEREEGWYIHDFAEHQETKADIETRRERNRIAGQKGGLAKAKRSAKRGAKQPASEVLSENVAEKEEEKEKQNQQHIRATSSRDCPSRFDDFWASYPRRRDRRKAEKAFANALKRTDADTIIDGASRYAHDPNRVEQFTKYAEGWLNGDGWLDEALPPRNGASNVTAFERKKALNGEVFRSLGDDATRLELER